MNFLIQQITNFKNKRLTDSCPTVLWYVLQPYILKCRVDYPSFIRINIWQTGRIAHHYSGRQKRWSKMTSLVGKPIAFDFLLRRAVGLSLWISTTPANTLNMKYLFPVHCLAPFSSLLLRRIRPALPYCHVIRHYCVPPCTKAITKTSALRAIRRFEPSNANLYSSW